MAKNKLKYSFFLMVLTWNFCVSDFGTKDYDKKRLTRNRTWQRRKMVPLKFSFGDHTIKTPFTSVFSTLASHRGLNSLFRSIHSPTLFLQTFTVSANHHLRLHPRILPSISSIVSRSPTSKVRAILELLLLLYAWYYHTQLNYNSVYPTPTGPVISFPITLLWRTPL